MRHSFVPRIEFALIAIMCVGFVLIGQTWSFDVYRFGLIAVMLATLLNIAVGNLPRDASPARALLLTLFILALVAAVFGAGILLVPTLATLGQSG
jgi:hypothetical protein